MSGFLPSGHGSRPEGDLARWPHPKAVAVETRVEDVSMGKIDRSAMLPDRSHLVLVPCTPLPLMPVHLKWLEESTAAYGFDNISETVRHLVFLANSEPAANKRLIFKIKRCLHCHVGARMGDHSKAEPSEPVRVYGFQKTWLSNIVEKCEVKSVDKAIRIICDYYMSRINQAENEEPGKGKVKERAIFTVKREYDSRVKVAEDRMKGETDDGPKQILSEDIQSDPAACSPEETAAAVAKCQVGRGSATYAEAKLETPEETARRRAKEEEEENTEEMVEARLLIRKTLGAVMG